MAQPHVGIVLGLVNGLKAVSHIFRTNLACCLQLWKIYAAFEHNVQCGDAQKQPLNCLQ